MQVRSSNYRLYAFLTSLIVFIHILSFPTAGFSVDRNQELNNLNNKISGNRQKINEKGRTKTQLQSEIKTADGKMQEVQIRLDKLEEELGQSRSRLGTVQAELDRLKAQLAKKQAELDSANAELDRLNEVLNLRAQNFYKHGEVTYLEVILSSRSFAELIHRADYLTRVVDQDARLLKEIKDIKETIETAKAAIEVNKDTTEAKHTVMVAEVNHLAGLTAEQQAEKDKMAAELNNKKAVIARIGDEQSQLLAEVQSEEADALELARIINKSPSRGTVIPIGSPSASGFIWPCRGPITGVFGESRPGHMHAGIDIAVSTGTPVVATKAGVVNFAGWMGGYGYVVDIDHGGGVSSRYGHNSRLLVSTGQTVSLGQQIAAAGSTGHSTGPHVHFEIRFNGTPVNPMNYLP